MAAKLVEKDLLGDDAAAMQVEDELAAKTTGARSGVKRLVCGSWFVPRRGHLFPGEGECKPLSHPV
jgi:hypothetical protein